MDRKQRIWEYDFPYFGALAQHVRKPRGIEPKQMAAKCGTSPSNIHKVEEDGRPGKKFMRKYLEALAEAPLDHLTTDQVEMLHNLRARDYGWEQHARDFMVVDPKAIKPSAERPEALTELMSELERDSRPAFVQDDLWFIHVLNGAALMLFGIDPGIPDDPLRRSYLHRWEAWHTVATKFAPDSPVRQAHKWPHEYFPVTLNQFFRSPSQRLFFTPQMRALLARINALSKTDNLPFAQLWGDVTNFKQDYFPVSTLARTIYYGNKRREIRVEGQTRTTRVVELGTKDKTEASYTLVAWNAWDTPAHEEFIKMQETSESRKIYYAVDYSDKDQPFHVNQWDEVQADLGQIWDNTRSKTSRK